MNAYEYHTVLSNHIGEIQYHEHISLHEAPSRTQI